MEVLYRLSYRGIFRLCGGGRIRTSVGEAGRFTVCSLWPLGHTPGHAPAALCAERPNMVANATDFSTDEKGLRETSNESPGRDSNPRPAAYKAAALPLSYPGAPPQAARRTLALPACQHAPASGFRFQHVPACGLHSQHASDLRSSLSARAFRDQLAGMLQRL
jgi:hypothetical protein